MNPLRKFSSARVSVAADRKNPPAVNGSSKIELHYLEWGSPQAFPIILLHGNSAHAHWWDFVAPELARHYRVIALDLRGHGESSWANPPAYFIRHYVSDLEQFITSLGLGSFSLVGHSLGGYIALSFALGAPQRLESLVAVDTKPLLGDGNNAIIPRLRNFRHPRYVDLADACDRFRPVPRGTRARPEVISHVARMGVKQREDGCWEPKFHRQAFASHPYTDLTASLPEVRCPVLLVRGGESRFVSQQTMARMAQRCRHGRVVEIAGSEHHVLLDQPEQLARTIEEFLEQTNGEGGTRDQAGGLAL